MNNRIMDNPNVVLDDDDLSEEETGETFRLRPYLDWRSDSDKNFPRVSSQVPLSPKITDEERDGEEETVERGNWTGRFDFILSLLGYSVGLGNVWRFPYLCYNNGGGAFLIPFIAMMILAGFPLLFMELAFGQYASLSPVVIFERFCPLFGGIGYGMIIVSAIVMLYYNMIIAWTIYYMVVSINKELPWEKCEPEWRTPYCYSYKEKDECVRLNMTYYNQTCVKPINTTMLKLTQVYNMSREFRKASADEYFTRHVLGQTLGIDDTGSIRWPLALSLLAAWVIVFLCLSRGVQSSGKVVYFTALFPYVVLVILFFRGITLPGAGNGIYFYVTPDWNRLITPQVWGDAAVQVFFALSPAWGGLITLASYNKFHNNCYKDAYVVLVANGGTSIFSGFVIFSIIGYLAYELDLDVKHVVDEGVGLAFMVYPEVVTRLPISPLWSFLFFFMLLTLGLDSQFALLETVQTAILDRVPYLREYKFWVLVCVSIFGYLGGLIFTTQSGVYWLTLFDKYAANFSVLIIAITECVLISWFYGAERFLREIEKMIGIHSEAWRKFWTFMWKFTTPITLFGILIFNWIKHEPAKSGNYIYPTWANLVGWFIAFLPTIVILAMMCHTFFSFKRKGFISHVRSLMQPMESWGPTHKNLDFKSAEIVEENGTVNNGMIRENSFDNPSFNVTYTFETTI